MAATTRASAASAARAIRHYSADGPLSTCKDKLGVPPSRPLADFLPTITIKAKDFANEITNFNIEQNRLRTEPGIAGEHVKNNQEVRQLLVDRGIVPEALPPAEDVKKIERRLKSDQNKLPKRVKKLKGAEKQSKE